MTFFKICESKIILQNDPVLKTFENSVKSLIENQQGKKILIINLIEKKIADVDFMFSNTTFKDTIQILSVPIDDWNIAMVPESIFFIMESTQIVS